MTSKMKNVATLNTVSFCGDNGRARRVVVILVSVLALIAVGGILLVIRFIDQERERDLHAWQIRLGIVANSRVTDIRHWLDDQFAVVQSLAQNNSLQMYVEELLDQKTFEDIPEVEGGYLRALLEARATSSGFSVSRSNTAITANISIPNQAGLAVLDAKGNLLVASTGMPVPLPSTLRNAVMVAATGQPALIDPYLNLLGNPSIGFVAPVYGTHANPTSDPCIGFIAGIRLADSTLYNRLEQPGETPPKGETYLVRHNGTLIDYISPLGDGTPPLKHGALALNTPNLDAAFVIENPGGFAEKTDYLQRRVLVTGRQVPSAPSWYLVRKIDRDLALQETDSRSTTMAVVFFLIIGGMLALILLVWRHGTSVRAAEAAFRYQQIASRLEHYTTFMRLVTDGQPTSIAAVDSQERYTFANKGAADGTGISSEDMIGKTMASVIGPVKARILQNINTNALVTNRPLSELHSFVEETGPHKGEIRTIKSDHIPLPGGEEGGTDVLMILQDITEVVRERQRRESTLRELVSTLVSLVDRRDPYSANQSIRVVKVARAIAAEMGESNDVISTVDIAANLMNLGKMWVPPEILTKTSRLTATELQTVRDSMIATADLLEDVHFDQPVALTLRQLQECWDGSGFPLGLSGEDILISARIVAVANAFVSMVSPRSYRDGLDFNQACATLMAEVNKRFDPRPVAALINYLNNRGGNEEWASYSTQIVGGVTTSA